MYDDKILIEQYFNLTILKSFTNFASIFTAWIQTFYGPVNSSFNNTNETIIPMKITGYANGIPISPSLNYLPDTKEDAKKSIVLKKRLITISLLCIAVAVTISLIAKFLVSLINLITNIA